MPFKERFLFALLIITFQLSAQTTLDITIQESEISTDELIFFSTIGDESFLINKCGDILRKWEHAGRAGLSGSLTHDGQLLRAESVPGCCSQFSTGGLLELYNLDGALNWSYKFSENNYSQHHDFHYMDNGNILFLGWEILSEELKNALGKRNSELDLWGEFVFEIKPIGTDDYELIWEWHLTNHLVQDIDPSKSNYADIKNALGKVDINYRGPAIFDENDWWHTNAIHYNKERDEILISCRSNGEIWIIDHSTTSEEAKTDFGGNSNKGGQLIFRWGNPESYQRGSSRDLRLFGPHGHLWIDEGLPNAGKILFFNNGDTRPEGYYSTVEMINPAYDSDGNYILDNFIYQLESHEIVYGENQSEQPLISRYLSNAQQLENGHFLINEGNEGRVFEVDASANIVWEMNIRDNLIDNHIVFRAYNYGIDYPGFAELKLSEKDIQAIPPRIETPNGVTLCNNLIANKPVLEWSTGETTKSITLDKTGEYYYTYINCFGDLISSDTLVVNELELDPNQLKIDAPDGIQLCGSPILLRAIEDAISWSTGQTGNAIFVSEEGEYSYMAENCVGDVVQSEVVVVTTFENPEPQIINITPGDDVTIFVPGFFVLWFEDENVFFNNASGNQMNLFNVQESVTFWVETISEGFSCFSDRVPITIIVDGSSTNNPSEENSLLLFPNPSSNTFHILTEEQRAITTVEIKDLSGKTIVLYDRAKEYDISSLSNGLYYVRVHCGKNILTQKLVVSR